MALIPLPSANKALAKLTIIPFLNKSPYTIPAGVPFVAMYNPTSFSKSSNQTIVELPKSDGLPPRLAYKKNGLNTIKVDLLLDATGASPAGGVIGLALSKAAKTVGSVDILIANFYATTKSQNPKTHEPNVLRVIWGAGLFFECILQSATVTYNLFDRLGRPLRATISATFKEAPSPSALSNIKNFFSSPDVTKTYTVVAGDSIYNLAQREYGDDSFYRQIAEFNNLKNYRKLVPGQVLYFPPINKEEVVE